MASIVYVCVEVFKKRCTSSHPNMTLDEIKHLDASLLPPFKSSLVQKIACTNAITATWKTANNTHPNLVSQ